MKIASGFRVVALLSALVGVGSPLSAQVVDFETQQTFSNVGCNSGPSLSDGGLTFTFTGIACFLSPTDPSNWPYTPASTILALGYSSTTMTRDNNSVFSLSALDMSAGTYGDAGTVLVTGFIAGGGTVSRNVDLDFFFQSYNFNWSNLTSVVFGELPSTGYIGFDNISYSSNVVPEPATAALMIPGIALAGFLSRRRRQRAS